MNDKATERALQDFESLLKGEKVSGTLVKVEVPEIDIKAIRATLGLSQSQFASTFCLSLNSIRNWEQGVRQPDAAARAYLAVVKHAPEIVVSAIQSEINASAVSLMHFVDDETGNNVSNLGDFKVGLIDGSTNRRRFDPEVFSRTTRTGDGYVQATVRPMKKQKGAGLAASTKSPENNAKTRPIAIADFGFTQCEFFSDEDSSVLVKGIADGCFSALRLAGHTFSLEKPNDGGYQLCVDLGRSEFSALVVSGEALVEVK